MSPTPKVGCQTYTWEMLGSRWTGSTDDILNAIAACRLRGHRDHRRDDRPLCGRPRAFGEALRTRGLELVAFGWSRPSGFTVTEARPGRPRGRRAGDRFVGAFPGAVLLNRQRHRDARGRRHGRDDRRSPRSSTTAPGSSAAGRACRSPSTPPPTTAPCSGPAPQYDRIMRLTDPALVGWVPDTGHIVRGGQDMLDTLRDHASRIRYVHLKDADADGSWSMMGRGAATCQRWSPA